MRYSEPTVVDGNIFVSVVPAPNEPFLESVSLVEENGFEMT